MSPPRILIIAGSDSGGGAGIQADIKAVTMMGGFAMTAVTAITAQNTLGVTSVLPVPTEMVLQQMDAVVDDLGVDAVKIGMIGSSLTAGAVAERLERLRGIPIVFDPVMVATSGATLADEATIAAFKRLMTVATVVTPNSPELAALTGRPIASLGELEEAARLLAERTGSAVLAKGGHLPGSTVTDLLVHKGRVQRWQAERIETRNSHGTGCTLASAVACGLGEGLPLEAAVDRARRFTRIALLSAPGFGKGHGPMGHAEAGPDFGRMNLNQVTVGATDYGTSVAFYRQLGLRQIVDSPPHYARFACPGGATLSIHTGEGWEGGGSTILYFESDDLDGWVERLAEAGIAIDQPPRDEPWQWREARLRDPAGNTICLYHAGEIRRFPPWRIDG